MKNNYFRIAVYSPEHNVSAIIDCNGHYDALWKFTSFFNKNGWKLVAIAKDDQFEEGNIPRVELDTEHIILRACMQGEIVKENGIVNILGRYYKNLR